MKPIARAAITAGSIVLVAAVALGFRTLNAWGVFSDVTPGFAGTCTAVPTASGPEDIVVDEQSGLVVISALDRRAKARTGKLAKTDGLYAFSLNDPTPHLRKLGGTPSDFHPHGLSLYRAPNGERTLFAINHRSDGTHSVDSFTVKGEGAAATLVAVGSIQGGLMVSPNAVAAIDSSRFYVTNDHTATSQLGRQLDDWLVLPRADTLYFDGNIFRPVAGRMVFPSGAVVSPDGRFLYVGEAYNRRVTGFSRNPISGELTAVGELALPFNVDNLRMGNDGVLWVAGRPKAFAMATYRTDPSKPAPSVVYKVFLNDGVPVSGTQVYANMGGEIGGSSVAAFAGHRLLIGSAFDTHILDCRMDH